MLKTNVTQEARSRDECRPMTDRAAVLDLLSNGGAMDGFSLEWMFATAEKTGGRV